MGPTSGYLPSRGCAAIIYFLIGVEESFSVVFMALWHNTYRVRVQGVPGRLIFNKAERVLPLCVCVCVRMHRGLSEGAGRSTLPQQQIMQPRSRNIKC